MTETDNGTTDEEEDEPITFAEIMEFAAEQIERETENVEAEVPDHGVELIVSNASSLLRAQTALEFENSQEEDIEDFEARPDDEQRKDLEEGVVELLLAIGALVEERDLDVEGAFRERRDFTEAYNDFQEAAQDAESHQEVVEAMEEHLGDKVDADAMMPQGQPMQMGGGIEPGDNVDADDYDAEDDRDRHIA